MYDLLTYLFSGIYTLTVIGVILVVITENRNPLKTLSWILIMLLAPVAGLICYFLFGQDVSKFHTISRRTRKRLLTRLVESTCADDAEATLPEQHRVLASLLRNTAHAVPLGNTYIEPITDGRTKMEWLLEAIEQATHHIHIQYYIFADDHTGTRLAGALMRKAQSGVEVRILYDDVGCARVKRRFFEQMREAGIEVRPFLHVRFPRFTSKVNYRNHRKIVVIDGRVGFIGGMNIADRYLYGLSPERPWRDTHFRVAGSGVAALQSAFLSDWSATTKSLPTGEEYYLTPVALPTEMATSQIQVMPSGPFGKWRTLLQADCYAIQQARRRIWIQTPYYLPNEELNSALQTAALAGVDVRLMLPARSDSYIVDLASHSYLDNMMRAGVKVLFYQPGFLHAKLLLVDDELTVVGSANMDFRSFEHNFEVSAFVYGRDFNRTLAAIFERDSLTARHVRPADWFRRPLLRRCAESFTRIIAPLL